MLADKYIKATNESMTWKLRLLYTIPRFIRRFICKINERNFMLDMDKYDNSTIIWHNIPAIYPKEIFANMTKIHFEDSEFYTIKEYDRYLTILYGDYMKLPDENNRGGHDLSLGKIIMDLHKDYKEYK